MTKQRIFIGIGFFILLMVLFVVGELFYISKNGSVVDAPTIPRGIQKFGSTGTSLTYIVMGDSTSIGQGADYKDSYAYQSAQYLAKTHQVSLLNVGISNARAKDVLSLQLSKAVAQKPDVVLLAVGANDVTHFTSTKSFQISVQAIIDGLRRDNCQVKIVVTGSPAMGSVPRFPIGARQLAGLRTKQINAIYTRLININNVVLAPVALRTGPAFAADPTLFASDNFHPTARGYALWTPVITQALDAALASTPEQCL